MKEGQEILMKHNDLVKSKYNISLNENKVFVYILYKLQKEKEGILVCDIKRDELVKFIKGRTDSSIKAIGTMLEDIRKKQINIKTFSSDGSYTWSSYGFINGWEYFSKTDTFRIEASERIYVLLHDYLKEGYTPVNINIWLTLRNVYAQRLYDLLRLWSGSKQNINYKISELRELFNLENKYSKYTDFKKRVIMPAIEELNSTGYFEINYEENKKSRNIDSIDFKVKDFDNRKHSSDEKILKTLSKTIVKTQYKSDKIEIEEKNTFKPSDKKFKKEGVTPKETALEFFIPDETLFTTGTLRSFKKDFKHVNFANKYTEKAFDEAVMIILDRDEVERIKAVSYNFFKTTLLNKIEEYKIKEKEDIEHQRDIEMFWQV